MIDVVIGGGAAGLVAARRLALGNREVVVLEAADRLGGRIGRHTVAGIELDSGAESFAVRGGVMTDLVELLGMRGSVVDPTPGGAWVALGDRTVPLPERGLLGIPSVPLASDVQRVLGARAAWRAYADRLIPVLKLRTYDDLGELVRTRMGAAVLERLVAPIVSSVYGRDPDGLPVDAIAPGLNAAITRSGTLSGAVMQLRTSAPAGSAVQGIDGGIFRLVDALAADLARFGVRVELRSRARSVEPIEGGGWLVRTERGDFEARSVVLAADGGTSGVVGASVIPGLADAPVPATVVSRIVTLVVDDDRLGSRPRGSGVLRAASKAGVRATALTHSTAKWAWLRDALPSTRHVLRLAYRGGVAVDAETARADASELLGIDLPQPLDSAVVVWRDTAPALAAETLARRPLVAADRLPQGIAVAGSWLSGTGLASVVAGADGAARTLLD